MAARRILILAATCACLFGTPAKAQDSQSLGDVARQARQQKQQKEAAASDVPADPDATPVKAAHVYTNDEIPEHPALANRPAPSAHKQEQPEKGMTEGQREAQAQQWKQKIHTQKSSIASLEAEIARVNSTVRYSSTNCYNCGQYNERQRQKQDEVEALKAKLEEQKKQLEELQEQARRQGFGSSVYDP